MTVFNDNKTLILRGIIALLIILISDQLSKEYMMGLLLEPQRSIEITSFFAFTPVWNYGVSFGMFKAGDATGVYMLVALSLQAWWGIGCGKRQPRYRRRPTG
jgi:lipoprotein signal peptidase